MADDRTGTGKPFVADRIRSSLHRNETSPVDASHKLMNIRTQICRSLYLSIEQYYDSKCEKTEKRNHFQRFFDRPHNFKS